MAEKADINFYRAFEDRHRGSREQIKARLRVYLPFVEPLCGFYAEAGALDLGCGRGEWLELMAGIGFKPYGIDLDEGMLSSCRELNLPAEKGEAVAFLAALPAESQAVVSAFHVVEHIGFEQLQSVVSEALRVLKPGGLLIMETPNPENLIVATQNFYLDPTHRRPIPPQLLSFLPEYHGFKKVKILRLQEPAELSGGKPPTLFDVLGGVSPDYAVVAQKNGRAEILEATDPAFEAEYGLSLASIVIKYDRQTESRARQTEAVTQKAAGMAQEIQTIYASRSWRLTAPLRWCCRQARLARQQGLSRRFKAFVKKILRRLIKYGVAFLGARPGLELRCAAVARRAGFYDPLLRFCSRCCEEQKFGHSPRLTPDQMTPRARRIYADLKAAIGQRRKGNG